MSNRVVRTTTQSWLSRLMGSVVGVLFGILLFFGSFFVLWINEGRTDLSTIADDSIAVSAASVDPANEGKLVAAAGTLSADEPLGDPEYLRSGAYLTLERNVEMYAWEENSSSTSETNLGGSETTTTEYTYEKGWTSSPESSSSFEVPSGHQNPELTVDEAYFTASSARVDAFEVDLDSMSLPSSESVPLDNNSLVQGVNGRINEDYLYMGKGTPQSPQVGDVRISFSAVPSGVDVTAFGEQQGSALVPFVRGNDQLYLAHAGDRASAIEALHTSYQVMGWVFRVVGFLMMWIGMGMVSGPLSTFLDVLPIFGSVSRNLIGFFTFGIALVLTAITVFIAALLQNIIALFVLLLFVVGVAGFLYWRSKNAPPKAPTPETKVA
jgi:hypothetical protein